eukprot:m51a1_g2103 hypothetical protein (634) ;mRNA; f:1600336-1604250
MLCSAVSDVSAIPRGPCAPPRPACGARRPPAEPERAGKRRALFPESVPGPTSHAYRSGEALAPCPSSVPRIVSSPPSPRRESPVTAKLAEECADQMADDCECECEGNEVEGGGSSSSYKEAGCCTTVMLRCLPPQLTRDELVRMLGAHHAGTFDVVYMPLDAQRRGNLGYAFVNLVSAEFVRPLVDEFDGLRWERFGSALVCAVSMSRGQGLRRFVCEFQQVATLGPERACRLRSEVSIAVNGRIMPFPLARLRVSRLGDRDYVFSDGPTLESQAVRTSEDMLPASLHKEWMRLPRESTHDKDRVLFGTKANRLMLWDVSRNEVTEVRLPASPPRARRNDEESAGIHDIDLCGSGALLVTGASDPCDLAVFALPALKPVCLLRVCHTSMTSFDFEADPLRAQGNEDWSFASKFLADDVVASGSRDSKVRLWQLPKLGEPFGEVGPLAELTDHAGKVRCLENNPHNSYFVTASADRTMKVWDRAAAQVERTMRFEDGLYDIVCLSVDEASGNLVAVGSQGGVRIVDDRCPDVATQLPALDGQWGVRCVQFSGNVLTIGGGNGSVSFYDIRGGRFRECDSSNFFKCSRGSPLAPTDGWDESPQAVYTLQYDRLKTKLFVGGGPLMVRPFGVTRIG